jgi:hypothetical protein
MHGNLICCRYDVAAFLSQRLFETGEPVMTSEFHLVLLKSLYDKDISNSTLESSILIVKLYMILLLALFLQVI